jgi:hypothetical protein
MPSAEGTIVHDERTAPGVGWVTPLSRARHMQKSVTQRYTAMRTRQHDTTSKAGDHATAKGARVNNTPSTTPCTQSTV